MKRITIRSVYNLRYYDLKLWEKVVLHFIEPEIYEENGMIITYKLFRSNMYILDYRDITHLSKPSEPSNGGVNNPWKN